MILKSNQIKHLLKLAGIALAIVLVIFTAAPGYGEEALTGEAAGLAASLNESLLLTFVGIFLIGLALNLTPCVYPMLAITVSIFGQQSESRSGLAKVTRDPAHGGILKVSPLADWTHDQVWDYIRAHHLPYNRLFDRGFGSIGCECCTRAVESGEHPRAGRWWWEKAEHKECGLQGRDWTI